MELRGAGLGGGSKIRNMHKRTRQYQGDNWTRIYAAHTTRTIRIDGQIKYGRGGFVFQCIKEGFVNAVY